MLGFGGQAGAKVDPELRLVSTQIFNDAMAEIQDESGQRIFPMALLPWWDRKLMIEEARRCHAMGLRGVNINPEPFEHKDADGTPLPDLGDPHWDGFWELCEDLDLPIGVQMWKNEPVSIGDGSWLGHGAIVLPGSRIGRHVVVAAGAVVAGLVVPDNAVVAGVPARVVRKYVAGEGWVAVPRDT